MRTTVSAKWSLLRRLVIGFGFSFLLLLLLSYGGLYYLLARGLEAQRDILLKDRLGAITALLKSPASGLLEIHNRVELEWPVRGGEKIYVVLRDGNGNYVTKTPGTPLSFSKNSFLVRSIIVENSLGLANPISVFVAIGKEQSQNFLESFRETMLAAFFASVCISLAVGWQIAKRGIRPIEQITNTVRGIGSKNLHERVKAENLPAEFHGLVTAFNETLDRLESSFELLSRFSSDIAHELRTPVTNIKGEMEIALTRSRNESEYRDILSSSLEECERLMSLVDSLLFLARAENFQHGLRRTRVSIAIFLEEIVEFFEASAAERGVSITINHPENADIVLNVESILLQRAIGNLVANAIQYNAKGGSVEITYSLNKSGIQIKVKDSGSGISEESKLKIFDRFYRVDSSRNHNSGGIGLGLAIVKSIVKLHGGEVTVKSSLSIGSEFSIELPAENLDR